ncbi:MAG: 23S rRNA (uracil(1939)-C(5))-methyltransferase RlmD [Firmicutes bacterium]|nr:23S rRNA (uracil(1939)-C(5))-methyltransferase RlmD [Bacillota bacterium]
MSEAAGRPRPGDVLLLEVDDLAAGGDAVAHHDGFAVFLPYGAVGDRVRARVLEVHPRYARAAIESVEAPAPARVAPPCPVFGRCGGCAWQHVAYEAQLAAKRKIVTDALERIGGFTTGDAPGAVRVREILGMARPWHYRNKAAVPVAAGPDGRVRLGYYARGSHEVVDWDDCHLEDERLVAALRAMRRLIERWRLQPYDEARHAGLVRHVVGRVAVATGELLLGLVLNGEGFDGEDAFARELRAAVPGLAGFVLNVQRARGNRILGPRTRTVWGRPYVRDKLLGLRFHVSLASFYQVNPAQTEALYRRALEYVDGTARRALDAYSGIGTIALLLAAKAEEVLGLEIVPEAVADARENARLNGVENARFEAAAVEERLPQLLAAGWRPDVAVLDPPRAGAHPEALAALAAAGVPRIVYVSCNPATFARDAAYLRGCGYRLVEVTPVDMFPQTAHVELCAQIVREG